MLVVGDSKTDLMSEVIVHWKLYGGSRRMSALLKRTSRDIDCLEVDVGQSSCRDARECYSAQIHYVRIKASREHAALEREDAKQNLSRADGGTRASIHPCDAPMFRYLPC